MDGKRIAGVIVALIGILFLAAGVGNIIRSGLTAALSNGLPYFGVGLLLVVASRYLIT